MTKEKYKETELAISLENTKVVLLAQLILYNFLCLKVVQLDDKMRLLATLDHLLASGPHMKASAGGGSFAQKIGLIAQQN